MTKKTTISSIASATAWLGDDKLDARATRHRVVDLHQQEKKSKKSDIPHRVLPELELVRCVGGRPPSITAPYKPKPHIQRVKGQCDGSMVVSTAATANVYPLSGKRTGDESFERRESPFQKIYAKYRISGFNRFSILVCVETHWFRLHRIWIRLHRIFFVTYLVR